MNQTTSSRRPQTPMTPVSNVGRVSPVHTLPPVGGLASLFEDEVGMTDPDQGRGGRSQQLPDRLCLIATVMSRLPDEDLAGRTHLHQLAPQHFNLRHAQIIAGRRHPRGGPRLLAQSSSRCDGSEQWRAQIHLG